MAIPMTRTLKLMTGKASVDVVVEVFWPNRHQSSWFCEWAIKWPDRDRTGSAGGVDAIQALVSAFKIVGSELYCSAEHQAGTLTWSDAWTGYGFPVPNNLRDLLIGDDALHL